MHHKLINLSRSYDLDLLKGKMLGGNKTEVDYWLGKDVAYCLLLIS